MARYFKYKSPDELIADAAALGSPQTDLPHALVLHEPSAGERPPARPIRHRLPPFDKQIYGLLWKEIKAQWAVQTIGADSTKR